jgi:hypothetical protein
MKTYGNLDVEDALGSGNPKPTDYVPIVNTARREDADAV